MPQLHSHRSTAAHNRARARTRRLVVAPGVIAAALILSACSSSTSSSSSNSSGSSNSSSSSNSTSAASLTKSPVKVGLIYTAGTPVLNEIAIPAALKAAARAANTRHGLGGHPVQIVACNDSGDANKSASCARQMASEKVVATISDQSGGNPDTVATMLNTSNIAQVGLLATSDLQFTCGTCFPVGAGSSIGYTAGAITAMKQAGATSVYSVGVAIPGLSQISQTYAPKAATAEGLAVKGYSAVAPTTADFAPIAAKIVSSKASAVYTFILSGQTVALARALQNAGFTGEISVPAGMASSDLHQLTVPNKIISWNSTPPVSANSLTAMKVFLSDLAAEHSAGDGDATVDKMDAFAPAAWLDLRMLEQLTSSMSDVTTASVLDALRKRTAPLDMDGFGPGWTPGTPTDLPKPLNNIGGLTKGWAMTVTGGAYQLDGGAQIDVDPALKAMLK